MMRDGLDRSCPRVVMIVGRNLTRHQVVVEYRQVPDHPGKHHEHVERVQDGGLEHGFEFGARDSFSACSFDRCSVLAAHTVGEEHVVLAGLVRQHLVFRLHLVGERSHQGAQSFVRLNGQQGAGARSSNSGSARPVGAADAGGPHDLIAGHVLALRAKAGPASGVRRRSAG